MAEVKGQEVVERFLRRALDEGRLAHAYIFVGPPGVGKSAMALELARALFCTNRKSGGNDELGACGECRNCRRIEHGNLADLHWLRREKGKRDIVIERARQLQEEMSLKAVEGGWKVFIVEEADRLNVSSENSLLKTLEEPPEKSVLILLAQELENFLPTVVSRCQVVRFRGLRAALIKEVLKQEEGLDEEAAGFISRMAGGSLGRARELAQAGFHESNRWLLDRLERMKVEEVFDTVKEMRAKIGEESGSRQDERETWITQLDGLMMEVSRRILKVGSVSQREELQGVIEKTMAAGEAITANANLGVVLENLLFDIAGKVGRGV